MSDSIPSDLLEAGFWLTALHEVAREAELRGWFVERQLRAAVHEVYAAERERRELVKFQAKIHAAEARRLAAREARLRGIIREEIAAAASATELESLVTDCATYNGENEASTYEAWVDLRRDHPEIAAWLLKDVRRFTVDEARLAAEFPHVAAERLAQADWEGWEDRFYQAWLAECRSVAEPSSASDQADG